MGETRSVKQSILGKQRNYVLDFMKVVAAFTVVFVHTTQNIFPSEVQVSGASGLFNYWSVTSDVGFWPRGFYTLGFYTFTTFYWMMNSYQKLKRQGVIHKGYDGELIYRYCAKNYISYWPALLICSLSGFVAFCMFSGGTVSQFIVAFLKGIPQFLGIDGFIPVSYTHLG